MDVPYCRPVLRLDPPFVGRIRCSACTPETPSRAHHARGSAMPDPQPRCAGSASSAVSGVAIIADGPARGACSVTTPSSSPSATTGPPDIPDHCDSPSVGLFRRQRTRSTAYLHRQQPQGQPCQHRHVAERICCFPEQATISCLLLHERWIADRVAALHWVARHAFPVHRGQAHRRNIDPRTGNLHQRQVRARPAHVADKPRIQRRLVHGPCPGHGP